MKSNYIKCTEGNLRVITAGETGKAVLLLSGAGLDNALLSWKHLIPELAPHYRVFAPDWPKQGKSTPWKGVADHDCLALALGKNGLADERYFTITVHKPQDSKVVA